MKEKLTREVIEALAKYSGAEYSKCENCPAAKICDSTDEASCKWLATALLEEMDKPKVWYGAPKWVNAARVRFFVNDRNDGHGEVFSETYTRELPKTRARIMAEEIASAQISNEKDLVDIIEQTINTHVKELKGEA